MSVLANDGVQEIHLQCSKLYVSEASGDLLEVCLQKTGRVKVIAPKLKDRMEADAEVHSKTAKLNGLLS